MRLLHSADWQIGMRAAFLGERAPLARMARLEAARRVVEIARRERVDFALVAGDTFEDNGVQRVTIRETARILGEAPCPVYVIPGNHDPAIPGSVWEDVAWRECSNIHLLLEPRPVAVPGGTLFPCPVRERWSNADPTAWVASAAKSDGIRIGMAHGSVEAAAVQDQTHPIPRDAAGRLGLDYLALGHFHSTATYPGGDGAVRMAYSGTHETTRFGERDSGNVLIIDIAGRGAPPVISAQRTGGLRWLQLRAAIGQPGELRALLEQIEAISEPERALVECIATGTLFASEYDVAGRVLEALEGRFLYGRGELGALRREDVPPAWVEQLPEGYLREAARDLLSQSRGEAPNPVSTAALRDFARIWEEVGR
ncbi:MAG TPA: DNA repair exonuclease [Bryobacteraceae bacterium]|nr:DNA repair exonuclease [Bryobacteraceae bacterium]